MSEEEQPQPRLRPQHHLKRLRERAAQSKTGPDGKCSGNERGDPIRPKGSGEVVSFLERTGRSASVAVGQKTRVLLIEPDETLRNYLKGTLSKHGFDVTVADHPDGRGMYQPGVETDVNGEFPLFNAIIWGYSHKALESGDIAQSAPDPVSAMRFNNAQRTPTVMITDVAAVKHGMEDRIGKNLITYPVIVKDREKMDLNSEDGLHEACFVIENAVRAGIAKANALTHPNKGKGR